MPACLGHIGTYMSVYWRAYPTDPFPIFQLWNMSHGVQELNQFWNQNRWREWRPFLISASGSQDLVDLHGVGGLAGTISLGAAVALAATQFHWQDPSLSTECSRCEKPSACFSVLGVAGLSPGRTSYPTLAYGLPKWVFVLLWGR